MKKNIVVSAVLLLAMFFSNAAQAGHWDTPEVSPTLMHIAGTLKIDGANAQVNDEVAVFDSAGNIVGLFVVETVGQYGDMPINGDIQSTLTADEGAQPGDALTIKVWSAGKAREYNGAEVSLIGTNLVEPYLAATVPLTFSESGFFGVTIAAKAAR